MPDYVSLFKQSPMADAGIDSFFSLLFLTLARILPIIALSPFFGARVLPHPVKVAFAIMLYIIFLPVILDSITRPIYFEPWIAVLLAKEIFIGFAIGHIISAPFSIVQSVGIVIDHQRGGASLLVNDPTIQNQSSPMGTLFNMILIYLFFVVDGPFYFMNAMVEAYKIMPPDRIFSSGFFSKDSSFWQVQFKLLNTVMVISTQLGAPALIAILMTDMFLGIANRLAPQVQITFLGLPLKSLLALLVVCLGFKLYNQQTIVVVFQIMEQLKTSISALGTKY